MAAAFRCRRSIGWPIADCATTASTPRRCARRRASRSSPAATITRTTPARSWKSPPRSPATPARGRRASRRSPKSCGRTATAPRVRQVSRDRAVGSQRLGAVRSLADAFGLRQVLRLHRRRDQPVGAAGPRRHRQGRSRDDARLSLHHRHDQPGDPVDSQPAVADAGQAVLQLLRHRRDARAAPRAAGVDREVQGPVRRRLGRSIARRPSTRQKKLGIVPAEREARGPARRHQGVGHAVRRREAAVRAADGSVRGVCRAHRLRDRPRRAGHRRHGRTGQHADLLRGRRQRRQRRRRHERHVQRDDLLQRRRRDGARHAEEHRQVGRSRHVPAHGRGLGGGRQHAVHVDQAGGVQLRRHAQPVGGQLAGAASRRRARSAASSITWWTSRRRCSKRRNCRSRRP